MSTFQEFLIICFSPLLFALLIIIVGLFIWRGISHYKNKPSPQIKESQDDGFRVVSEDDIVNVTFRHIFKNEKIPTTTMLWIKPLNYRQLSEAGIKVAMREDNWKDIQRGVTISSAMYHYSVPTSLVLIDAYTQAFFYEVKKLSGTYSALQLKKLIARHEDFTSDVIPHSLLDLCRQFLPLIGGIYMSLEEKSRIMPPLKTYLAICRATFKRETNSTALATLTDKQVQEITTAFAIMVGITLPASYVVISTPVKQLAGLPLNLKYKAPRLKLVDQN
jgi:hypothetical protein